MARRAEFSFEDKGRQVSVTVAPCATVLAVLDALAADRPDGQYLVILTPCETREVGDSVLALAMQPEIKPVDRWDLVKDAFGALSLDPALTKKKDNGWIAEALLDAQPAGGWRRLSGTVLSRATRAEPAGRHPARHRRRRRLPGGRRRPAPVDRRRAAVETFLRLRDEERTGLIAWLAETTGGVADVVFAMAATGKVPDAVPFGLAVAALYGPPPHARAASPEPATGADETFVARVRAEERYLGGRHRTPAALRAFGEAAESLVIRWADNGHAAQAAALCERAEAILAELAGTEDGKQALASRSRVLEAGLDARFTALADALTAALPTLSGRRLSRHSPSAAVALAAAEEAFVAVRAHGRKRDRDTEIRAAADAVRLARWLAAPEEPPATLAEAATRMLRSWAWADRALASIARADTGRVPKLAQAYAALWERARDRRAGLDADFARKLAAWTEASSASDDLLLVENLLDRIARPVAEQRLPVIVVLDGMTAAAGVRTRRGAHQPRRLAGGRPPRRRPRTRPRHRPVGHRDLPDQPADRHAQGRGPGPGAGRVRRLLGQAQVRALPQGRPRPRARPPAGQPGPRRDRQPRHRGRRRAQRDRRRPGQGQARPGPLDPGSGHLPAPGPRRGPPRRPPGHPHRRPRPRPRPGERPRPRAAVGVRPLPHGHPGARRDHRARPARRHRRGRGRRRGRRDDPLHAQAGGLPRRRVPGRGRHPGHHPAARPTALLPPGWYAYDAAGHAPAWWDAPASPRRRNRRHPVRPRSRPGRPQPRRRRPAARCARRRRRALRRHRGRHPAASTAASSPCPGRVTLGGRVVASPRMASQRQAIPRAPAEADVAALIDALAEAGGRLTIAEAAAVTGQPAVRMSRYLAQVARLLNVDSYAVLNHSEADRLVELNVPLLRQQFLGE